MSSQLASAEQFTIQIHLDPAERSISAFILHKPDIGEHIKGLNYLLLSNVGS
jgi:hypothetical protein